MPKNGFSDVEDMSENSFRAIHAILKTGHCVWIWAKNRHDGLFLVICDELLKTDPDVRNGNFWVDIFCLRNCSQT